MSERLHVSVDFEAAVDPIAGTLTVGGAQRPFTGWLGLIAALEAAIAGRSSATRTERSWSNHDDTPVAP
jgi:hypothetical protein